MDFTDAGFLPDAQVIPLKGFSGCRVALVNEGGQTYVRKLARDTSYNDRLLRQAAKQDMFRGDGLVRGVAVRHVGQTPSGLVYIDMEYVTGASAAETIAALPLSEIPHWIGMLGHFADGAENGVLEPAVFQEKIADLRSGLAGPGRLTAAAAEALIRLSRKSWANIPQSPCHGDLTFENILVHKGQLYLIDFLDVFAESWYLDIAKLLQDLVGGWSFRHHISDRNLILRLASLRHGLESLLEQHKPGCMAVIRDLYVLGLLRILPYCSLDEERAFIDDRLDAALRDFL